MIWSQVGIGCSLGEDDLAAGCLRVELADGDDLVDLRDEVVDGEAEHVDGRPAGVEVGAGVGDELDELGDGWDVDLLHLPLHHPSSKCGEAGQRAEQRGHVHAGVADRRDLDVLVAVSAYWVGAEKGKKEAGLFSSRAGPVANIEA